MSDRSARTARPDEQGQALAEFALAGVVIFFTLFAIFDFGRAVYAYNTLSDAARTAARVAIVNQDVPSITAAAVSQALALGLTDSDVEIHFRPSNDPTADCAAPPVVENCIAEVKVSYTFMAATPLVDAAVGAIDMSSTSRLPIESVASWASPTPSPAPTP